MKMRKSWNWFLTSTLHIALWSGMKPIDFSWGPKLTDNRSRLVAQHWGCFWEFLSKNYFRQITILDDEQKIRKKYIFIITILPLIFLIWDLSQIFFGQKSSKAAVLTSLIWLQFLIMADWVNLIYFELAFVWILDSGVKMFHSSRRQ